MVRIGTRTNIVYLDGLLVNGTKEGGWKWLKRLFQSTKNSTDQSADGKQTVRQRFTLFQQFCYIFLKMAHLPAFNYLLIASLMYLTARSAHANPGAYGHNKVYNPSYTGSQPYLPALPGKRPSCAGPSDTFCTKIDYYPT